MRSVLQLRLVRCDRLTARQISELRAHCDQMDADIPDLYTALQHCARDPSRLYSASSYHSPPSLPAQILPLPSTCRGPVVHGALRVFFRPLTASRMLVVTSPQQLRNAQCVLAPEPRCSYQELFRTIRKYIRELTSLHAHAHKLVPDIVAAHSTEPVPHALSPNSNTPLLIFQDAIIIPLFSCNTRPQPANPSRDTASEFSVSQNITEKAALHNAAHGAHARVPP